MHATSPLTQRQLIWLDADQSLGLDAHARFADLGWDVQVFDRLQTAVASLPRAQAIVLRLDQGVERLRQLNQGLSAQGLELPIICRVGFYVAAQIATTKFELRLCALGARATSPNYAFYQ